MRFIREMRTFTATGLLALLQYGCAGEIVFPDTPLTTSEILAISRDGAFTPVIAKDCIFRVFDIAEDKETGYVLSPCNKEPDPLKQIHLLFFEEPNVNIGDLVGKSVTIYGTYTHSETDTDYGRFSYRTIQDAKIRE